MKHWIALLLATTLMLSALVPVLAESETNTAATQDATSSASVATDSFRSGNPDAQGPRGMGRGGRQNGRMNGMQNGQMPAFPGNNAPQMDGSTDAAHSGQMPTFPGNNAPQTDGSTDAAQNGQMPAFPGSNAPQTDGSTDAAQNSQMPAFPGRHGPQMNGMQNMPAPHNRINIAALREQIASMEDGEEKDALIQALENYENALRNGRPHRRQPTQTEAAETAETSDAAADDAACSLKSASEALLALLNSTSSEE